jgi:hypothetical protein
VLEDVRAEHHVKASVHRRIEVVHADRERRRITRCWTGLQGSNRGLDRPLEQEHVLESGTDRLDGDDLVSVRPKARRDRPDAAPHLEDASRSFGVEQRRKQVEGDRDLVEVDVELVEELGTVGSESRQLQRRGPLQFVEKPHRGCSVVSLFHLRAGTRRLAR